MNNIDNESGYMTVNEVLHLFKISKSKLYDDMGRGLFPRPIKFGKLSRFPVYQIVKISRYWALRRTENEIKDLVKSFSELADAS